jgi:hypothetical protein
MSPIPGEPLDPKEHGLTTSDGRKFKLKGLGIKPLGPVKTEERGSEEPPRDDPRPNVNPNAAGF